MRKLLISILLAGAAASPALAQDHGRWRNDEARSENQQSREDRSQAREERSQAREQRQEMREQARAERFSGGANAERMQQAQQQAARQFEARQQAQRSGGWDRSRSEGRGDRSPQQVVEQQQQRNWRDRQQSGGRDGDQRRWSGYRGGFAGTQGDQVQRTDRNSGGWSRDRGSWSQNRDGDFRQRSGDQQRYRDRSRWTSGGWNRDWRNDRRYDWRSYRDRHRSVFRLGVYIDPFGYGYRPFDIGYRLQPFYFGQRYWIDPSIYQLPFPPPGTQWVRYWNDAVLVDMYTGEVVDVIHNFFW